MSERQKKKVKVFTNKKKSDNSEIKIINQLKEKYKDIDTSQIKTFKDFPLCSKTLKGLAQAGYKKPTEIQRECIGLSLQEKDILGAAQTGSGKTLAFIVPILERLFCEQWTRLDGVGALVITPTRELAYQIFETLRKVGIYHDFSAGLIIGGKDLKFERDRMDQCNIVICTPGRLLHHMDENPLFNCDSMKILVLDEADRCLDMGFKQTMNAIIANLPQERQTLLYSATQTKSVKDLARLSLKNPSYVSVHEHAKHSTPPGLTQSYIVCELHDKLTVLWSFIKNHLKMKTIVFFSTCKQVKFVYEAFSKLRPGVSLLALYGSLHQLRRMKIYEDFCRKQSAVLFATDLVSRGLDFPAVHWVVQADCPEDPETYIHRVGRTARYHKGGESLLLLEPGELKMLELLDNHKIPINKIDINPDKLNNPVRKIEAFLAMNQSLKDVAQRAFVAYVKAIFLRSNKDVFDAGKIDRVKFSESLGLGNVPRVRFIERSNARVNKECKSKRESPERENVIIKFNESDEDDRVSVKEEIESHSNFSDDDLMIIKKEDHDLDSALMQELTEQERVALETGRTHAKKPTTRAALTKRMLRNKVTVNNKVVFDDEGEPITQTSGTAQSESAREYKNKEVGGIDPEKVKLLLKEEDKYDKERFKGIVKAKKKEMKKKLKQKRAQEDVEDFGEDSEDEPDLSWLPDPDKIYGKDEDDGESVNAKRNSDSDEVLGKKNVFQGEECENVTEEAVKKNKAKRKRKEINGEEKLTRKKKRIEGISETLSVNEAEELAMLLLRNK